MRKFTLALVLAVLPAFAAAQQSAPGSKRAQKPATPHRATSNPCAQYGVGFAKIAGLDTCVKIGGSVSVEGSGNARR
jgi:hypothetical protein